MFKLQNKPTSYFWNNFHSYQTKSDELQGHGVYSVHSLRQCAHWCHGLDFLVRRQTFLCSLLCCLVITETLCGANTSSNGPYYMSNTDSHLWTILRQKRPKWNQWGKQQHTWQHSQERRVVYTQFQSENMKKRDHLCDNAWMGGKCEKGA